MPYFCADSMKRLCASLIRSHSLRLTSMSRTILPLSSQIKRSGQPFLSRLLRGDGGLVYVKFDPLLASLRKDARLAAMVTKLGLPP